MSPFRQRLASVLEWNMTDKSILLMVLVIPILLLYAAGAQYTLLRADVAALAHVGPLRELLYLLLLFAVGAVAIALLGLTVRPRHPDSLALQYLSTLYYAAILVSCSYYIGTMTFCTGVVVLGAPVFGFILLERKVVWAAALPAILSLAGLSAASIAGWLPYAPAVVQPHDLHSIRYWSVAMLLLSAPHLLIILLLADQMLMWWRQREDLVRTLSLTDPLTGIANRRCVLDHLGKEVARTLRHGPPLTVLLLDLDLFKRINDTWGHPMGDRVLLEATQVLQDCIRKTDVIGRFGGEEFMILLPDTPQEGALILAERCRQRLQDIHIQSAQGERVPVSGSFGLVCNQQNLAISAEQLVHLADAALYKAKSNGRNRVEVAIVP